MSERCYYLDRSPGEVRGVVTLDGRPERLFLARDTDDPRVRLGARSVARVRRVEAALGTAFLDLGGIEAISPFKPEARPVEGAAIEVEIRSEPRRSKLAVVRMLGPGEGSPRLLEAAPDLSTQLAHLARGAEVVTGEDARRNADQAEQEALATVHALPGGGDLAIEPTRALTAIDIDLGERKGTDAKRVTRQANLTAIGLSARLLRLKAIGGLVVIDLVGRGHDGQALLSAAKASYAPDNPGVVLGPVTKFGTMELSVPRRTAPVAEVLCRSDGQPSEETLALRLVRRLQSEARAQRGVRLEARAHPAVAGLAAPRLADLIEEVGARVSLAIVEGAARDHLEIRSL